MFFKILYVVLMLAVVTYGGYGNIAGSHRGGYKEYGY
ncbi:unnamed protein product [Danaus chrysippus]|uniref:(African queen) hypothetical protein n=1 Tax=Danaus chrysippus TaxID=151541 RepID=A0A8J2QJQ6_9NEOP|nr:unnamed protein product [Danaus chrysippus]